MLLRLLLLLAVVAAGLFVLYHVLPWLLLGLALHGAFHLWQRQRE